MLGNRTNQVADSRISITQLRKASPEKRQQLCVNLNEHDLRELLHEAIVDSAVHNVRNDYFSLPNVVQFRSKFLNGLSQKIMHAKMLVEHIDQGIFNDKMMVNLKNIGDTIMALGVGQITSPSTSTTVVAASAKALMTAVNECRIQYIKFTLKQWLSLVTEETPIDFALTVTDKLSSRLAFTLSMMDNNHTTQNSPHILADFYLQKIDCIFELGARTWLMDKARELGYQIANLFKTATIAPPGNHPNKVDSFFSLLIQRNAQKQLPEMTHSYTLSYNRGDITGSAQELNDYITVLIDGRYYTTKDFGNGYRKRYGYAIGESYEVDHPYLVYYDPTKPSTQPTVKESNLLESSFRFMGVVYDYLRNNGNGFSINEK